MRSELKAMLSRIIRENGNYVTRDKAAEGLREFTELEQRLAEAESVIRGLKLSVESARQIEAQLKEAEAVILRVAEPGIEWVYLMTIARAYLEKHKRVEG